MTNEERLAAGKFCLCTDKELCDFHKRGGYTTSADWVKEVKEEIDNELESR